jgi:hypothetical protein
MHRSSGLSIKHEKGQDKLFAGENGTDMALLFQITDGFSSNGEGNVIIKVQSGVFDL